MRAWPYYIISVLFALAIGYYLNNWKFNKIYSATTTFKIKDNSSSNSALASNSINFIWGGNSNKVDGLSYTLSSRAHNEKVVKQTASYIYYFEEGRIKKSNIYKLDAPYVVEIDTTHLQVVNAEILIETKDASSFYMKIVNGDGRVYDFQKDSIIDKLNLTLPSVGAYGQWIISNKYKFRITKSSKPFYDSKFSFTLVPVSLATQRVMKDFSVSMPTKIASIISVSKNAESLNEAVDLLNNSIEVLKETEMAEKVFRRLKPEII